MTALLVPVASAGISPSPALATTTGVPSGLVIFTVNAGPGEQSDPHISGNRVTYTSSIGGDSEIRYHDLATGSDTAIPTAASLDVLSDVSGSTAVVTRLTATASAIAGYDTATGGPAVVLDPQPGSFRRDPSIGGNTVAWEDLGTVTQGTGPEIVAYDIGSATATRLTDDSLPDFGPAVAPDGSVIAWTKCAPNTFDDCTVWSAARGPAGWATIQLTPTGERHGHVDTNGSLVVYSGVVAGDSDIFWRPAGGGVERRLALPGPQFGPSISGHLIAFVSFETTAGIFNEDIMVYDLDTDTVYRLTTTQADETQPDLWVTPGGLVRVVYTAQEGTETNVFAATFSPPRRDKIAFSSTRDGNAEIYSMNANGTGLARLTSTPGVDTTPAWSPDGARIVFSSTRDGNAEIYSMNANGSGLTRLTTHLGIDTTPAW
ncbi:MAG: PD40 domain-containing protein [Propionibacteriales bacterium]|nr:PD40 domain-containing protein [Propionibacteriales bacterium]